MKKELPVITDFSKRLRFCAAEVGSIRNLSKYSNISEAMLYRYINGESDIPRTRAEAVANAAGVDLMWLLEAHKEKPHQLKEIRAKIMAIQKELHNLLEEVDRLS